MLLELVILLDDEVGVVFVAVVGVVAVEVVAIGDVEVAATLEVVACIIFFSGTKYIVSMPNIAIAAKIAKYFFITILLMFMLRLI